MNQLKKTQFNYIRLQEELKRSDMPPIDFVLHHIAAIQVLLEGDKNDQS